MNYMYHHPEFKYLNPFMLTPFTPISLACMLRHVAITLFLQPTRTLTSCFSYLRKHGLSTSPLRSVTLSLSLYITWFSLSLTSLPFSGITRYLSFLFNRHTHSLTRLSLCLSLYGVLSHTLYGSRYDSYH